MNGKAAILIGSETDRATIEASKKYFDYFDIEMDLRVMSAHRNPAQVAEFATSARDNGYSVLIGAAGMAAHLAGALKAHSTLPVIGIPLGGGIEDGLDALMSTVQMPKGVPVATMAVGKAGAINAAILTAEIISLNNNAVRGKLTEFKNNGAKL
ncbi:MAG: 5-(carboxyamino)imidazole ribonucleotide mutase [Candidatus Marinimicrobia bacterium]|nr:5-(carboxyamino)imidazole ribonucleotide mutase [Candidatus Neomarinimicrobiota bacterium]MDP6852417.1 5-(carboxyamino)imidazole ribonucleotide mutase [Candidatus Neomarinimicrobiota bacterium]